MGESALGDTTYKQRAVQLVKLGNDLRDVGAADLPDGLPAIVVCGNQSAGKSSLLERLCDVQLPRATGTCTKSPAEVRLISGGAWSCDVKLRYEFDYNNNRLASPEEKPFAHLDESMKDQLEHYISAAQKALLNPTIDVRQYHRAAKAAAKAQASSSSSTTAPPDPAEEAQQKDTLKFTKNVVVVDIKGAAVDLTLIDLPGIIQSDEDNPENVQLVSNLVKEYVQRQRAIIVATVSCKDDIDNQAILSLARSVDPEGLRTIGVLTKPDTIEAGTHSHWLPLLRNEKYKLQLGYYVVRNPTQEELDRGTTLEDAAVQESQFFSSDAFWGSHGGAGAALNGRVGVEALRLELSRQLVKLTEKEIPGMIQTVEAAIQKVDPQLKQLAAPPSDPILQFHELLQQLKSGITTAVAGSGDDMSFAKAIKQHYRGFRNKVLSARPHLKLECADAAPAAAGTAAAAPPAAGTAAAGTIASSVKAGPWGTPGQSAAASVFATPTLFGATAPAAPSPAGLSFGFAFGTPPSSSAGDRPVERAAPKAPTSFNDEDTDFWFTAPASLPGNSSSKPISIKDVQHLTQELTVKELPGHVPYRVLEHLIEQHKGAWKGFARECVLEVGRQLQKLTQHVVGELYGRFPMAQARIRGELFKLQEELEGHTTDMVSELMDMEQKQTWTQNDHYFEEAEQRFLKHIKKRRLAAAGGIDPDTWACENMGPALAALAALGIPAVTREDLTALMYEKQARSTEEPKWMAMVAGTLAYFKVSSKRVIDEVPMHINHYLLEAFSRRLTEHLLKIPYGGSKGTKGAGSAAAAGVGGCEAWSAGRTSMNMAGEDGVSVEMLMEEDKQTADRRRVLAVQSKQLHQAHRILVSIS